MGAQTLLGAPMKGGAAGPGDAVLQRTCAACENGEEDQHELQRKASVKAGGTEEVPAVVHDLLRSSGQPLDPATRTFMEPRFGHDFSGVRVHTGAQASASARAVNAEAYTVGRHVVFRDGAFAPGSAASQRLVAHELAHVVQQAGTLGGGVQGHLEVGEASSPFEHEADRAADAVMRGDGAQMSGAVTALGTWMVQRQPVMPDKMKVGGDTERKSPPGGVAITGGVLNWSLKFSGQWNPTPGSDSDVTMDAAFTAGPADPSCQTLAFVQSINPSQGGQAEIGAAFGHLQYTRDPGSGASIDTRSEDLVPYSYASPDPQGGISIASPTLATLGGSGPGRGKTAKFHDAPSTPAIIPNVTARRAFELAVICVDSGQTFGSVKWGYMKTDDGTITLTGGEMKDVQVAGATTDFENVRKSFYAGKFQQSLGAFSTGSDALTDDHKLKLKAIAAQKAQLRKITLIGANDNSGGSEANGGLSVRRAEAAKAFLITAGIDASKIEASGIGVAAREANPPGKDVPANRRVDVMLHYGEASGTVFKRGSSEDARRLRRQDPRDTLQELMNELFELRAKPDKIRPAEWKSVEVMLDALDRWRATDPTIPQPRATHRALLDELRAHVTTSSTPEGRIKREEPTIDIKPNDPPELKEALRKYLEAKKKLQELKERRGRVEGDLNKEWEELKEELDYP